MRCQVPGCHNIHRRYKLEQVHFHTFPTKPEQRRRWLEAIRHPKHGVNTPERETRVLRVCSEHFAPSDYLSAAGRYKPMLRPGVVPSVFPWSPAADHAAGSPSACGPQIPDSPEAPPAAIAQPAQAKRRLKYVPVSLDLQGQPSPLSSSSAEDIEDPHRFTFEISILPATSGEKYSYSSSEGSSVKEKRWVVSESRLMELFKTCFQCKGPIVETKKIQKGWTLVIQWECINSHSGQWSSCSSM